MQFLACNFTKSSTPPWVFYTFFKLYKCCQIAQSVTLQSLQSFTIIMFFVAIIYVLWFVLVLHRNSGWTVISVTVECCSLEQKCIIHFFNFKYPAVKNYIRFCLYLSKTLAKQGFIDFLKNNLSFFRNDFTWKSLQFSFSNIKPLI